MIHTDGRHTQKKVLTHQYQHGTGKGHERSREQGGVRQDSVLEMRMCRRRRDEDADEDEDESPYAYHLGELNGTRLLCVSVPNYARLKCTANAIH